MVQRNDDFAEQALARDRACRSPRAEHNEAEHSSWCDVWPWHEWWECESLGWDEFGIYIKSPNNP